MPQMGVSVSEGTVTKWLKQVGEQIEADETLLEISTDKVDTEVPSPASGLVSEILVQEGQTVDVGTLLARIGGEAGAAAPPAAAPAPGPRAGGRASRARAPRPRARRASGATGSAGSAVGRERQGVRLAGRRPHRLRARDRPRPGARYRHGRTRDEEGHPGFRRVRRPRRRDACAETCAGSTTPAAPHPAAPARRPPLPRQVPPALRGRDARAYDRDAARDRRAHAPLARHLRARHLRDRGRHVEGRRRSARS